ncbi:MAG: site-specific integrase [Pseudomonadota bacterium]
MTPNDIVAAVLKALQPSVQYSWYDASTRYLQEVTHEKTPRSLENDLRSIEWLNRKLEGVMLHEITKDLVHQIITERQKPTIFYYEHGQIRECTPGISAINRFLTTFRAVLYRARDEWEWINRAPRIKSLKGEKNRIRWISREEANRLIAYLPQHLAIMAEFSLQTGLRRHNVTHLKWSEVDLARKMAWVLPSESKNRKALAVPLSNKACKILEKQFKEYGKISKWVFPYRDKPVKQTSTKAFRDALERAEIDDFRWHDFRHTWASWHIQKGTPLMVLKELGGWSCLRMVQRYAHLSSEHLRAYVDHAEDKATLPITAQENTLKSFEFVA